MKEIGRSDGAQNGPSQSGDPENKMSWELKLRLMLLLRYPREGIDIDKLNDEYMDHWEDDPPLPESIEDSVRQKVPNGVRLKDEGSSTIVRGKPLSRADFRKLKLLISRDNQEVKLFSSFSHEDMESLSLLLNTDGSVPEVAGTTDANPVTGAQNFALMTSSTKPPVSSVEMPSNLSLEPGDNNVLPMDLMEIADAIINETTSRNQELCSERPCENEVTTTKRLIPDRETHLHADTGCHSAAENVNLSSEIAIVTSSISPDYYPSPWRSPIESDTGYSSGEALLGGSSERSCNSNDEVPRDRTCSEVSRYINGNVLPSHDVMQHNFSASTSTAIANIDRAVDGTGSEETHCHAITNEGNQSEPVEQTTTVLKRTSKSGDCGRVNSTNRVEDSTVTLTHDQSVTEAEAAFSSFTDAAKYAILAEKMMKGTQKSFSRLEQWGHIVSYGLQNRALFFVGGDQTVLKWSAKKWIHVPGLCLPKNSIIYGELDEDNAVFLIIDAHKLEGVELDKDFDKRRQQCLKFARRMSKGKLSVEVAELHEVVDECDEFVFAKTVERLRQTKGKLSLQNGQKVTASEVLFLRCYHSSSDFWSVMKTRFHWKKPGSAILENIERSLLAATYGDDFGALDFIGVVTGHLEKVQRKYRTGR